MLFWWPRVAPTTQFCAASAIRGLQDSVGEDGPGYYLPNRLSERGGGRVACAQMHSSINAGFIVSM
eukprot:13571230-Alexandrium_andersonii.AAC.1